MIQVTPDQEWLALKAGIERVVPLEATTITLGNREFTWYRVSDPDRLLDAAVTDASTPAEEIDPFWAATWRAALGLDQFLGRLDIAGQRVLELGCGSGQAGVGAATRGAVVTMTDAVQLALQVARLNAWPVAEKINFQQLKWNGPPLDAAKFPIVIGSDLVYDTSLFAALESCAREHLAQSGRLYLSEPHRHTGNRFSTWIVEHGWRTREHDVDLRDQRIPIRIFECWLE